MGGVEREKAVERGLISSLSLAVGTSSVETSSGCMRALLDEALVLRNEPLHSRDEVSTQHSELLALLKHVPQGKSQQART